MGFGRASLVLYLRKDPMRRLRLTEIGPPQTDSELESRGWVLHQNSPLSFPQGLFFLAFLKRENIDRVSLQLLVLTWFLSHLKCNE